ncbi:NADH dehydrogenase [ubiquinone] 1 alpha subcomplex subunit 2-like [Sycon ciliatum]|uniref:NADH dehydrogenase [ubiquinone] 1 alpha subcomplex subunit 2-like n=1 Tax=Sycon ciliatum TaxID=27933 RepID=UPI0020AE46A0
MANVLKKGLARNLREIRIHLCQTASSSNGVRQFIEENYVAMKKANPSFPILIRECSGIQPKLYTRFARGEETHAELTDMTSAQVNRTLQKLVDEAPQA